MMNEQLASWLISSDNRLCSIESNYSTYIFLRLEKDTDFDYLFVQSNGKSTKITRENVFEYAGIFCKLDHKIYDAQYELEDIDDREDLKTRDGSSLQEQLQTAVCEMVEKFIGNDRNNLRITEVTDTWLKNKVNNDYYIEGIARELFLSSNELPIFRCDYRPKSWTEESLLAYIRDKERYVENEAAAYINKNQETMFCTFLMNDKITKTLREIQANADAPLHFIKKIKLAVDATPAKTVNVTILKNGIEFTFKTDAVVLRNDRKNYYSSWHMAAADRRRFEQIFGKNAGYTPNEILRITYARNVIYEAETRA